MEASGSLLHLIRELSVMQRIREMQKEKRCGRLRKRNVSLGNWFLSLPLPQSWYMGKGKILKQKSSELDIESALSRDPACDT